MAGLAIELEADQIIVGQPVRGRVLGDATIKDVILRAQELRGTEFHQQVEGRAEVESDGTFELPGPMQPSFFGEQFSIEWMVVARTPNRELEHVVHVIAPMATRRVDTGRLLTQSAEEGWVMLVLAFILGPCLFFFTALRTDSLLVGAIFGVLAFVYLFVIAGRTLLRYRVFSSVRFEFDEEGARYDIKFKARQNVLLQRVFVRLACFEQVPNLRTRFIPRRFQKVQPQSDVELEFDALASARELLVGDEVHLRRTVELSDDAPYTLVRYGAPSIEWRVELWVGFRDTQQMLAARALTVDHVKLLEQDRGSTG